MGPMTPTPEQRDQLFKDFARALFKNDLQALYQAVSPGFRVELFRRGFDVTATGQP